MQAQEEACVFEPVGWVVLAVVVLFPFGFVPTPKTEKLAFVFSIADFPHSTGTQQAWV